MSVFAPAPGDSLSSLSLFPSSGAHSRFNFPFLPPPDTDPSRPGPASAGLVELGMACALVRIV